MPTLPHVLVPALAAGIVAILATVAIERLGGRRGGLLGSLPTTVVPAALGFWWGAASVTHFRDALYVVPAGMLVNALFLWCWRSLPPRLPKWPLGVRLAAMVIVSMTAWAGGALLLLEATSFYRDAGRPMAPWGWAFFAASVGVEARRSATSSSSGWSFS